MSAVGMFACVLFCCLDMGTVQERQHQQ